MHPKALDKEVAVSYHIKMKKLSADDTCGFLTDRSKAVIIMRGVPGSGKSTFVKNLTAYASKMTQSVAVCSADHYFEKPDGSYLFNPKLLGEAHRQCLRKFINYANFTHRTDFLVVDNTNIATQDYLTYKAVAEAFGWEVFEVLMDVPVQQAIDRCIHNVPESTIIKKYDQLHFNIYPASPNLIVVDNTLRDSR